jgi:hypothetical protein
MKKRINATSGSARVRNCPKSYSGGKRGFRKPRRH